MRNFGFEERQEPAAPPPGPAAGSLSPARPATTAAPRRDVAVLGPTLRFKGELSAEEDFILQGRIEGSINHTQSVTIGTEGVVQGNIHARVVVIDGCVEGDLHGIESVVVNATGRVTGNIFAPRVGLVDGAFFNGRIDMGARQAAGTSARTTQPGVALSAEETERMLGAKQ
ncbi:MAG TPA: polymer-forming cytoskeletal protein [Steroidobacteraceae bacterium]|nr:polymer-forming cytoskeletal protein [Steroidobacteraceae bacterium]